MFRMVGSVATWFGSAKRSSRRALVAAAIVGLLLPALFAGASLPWISAKAHAQQVVPILFPFEERIAWTDTWGASRGGGSRSHEGNDMPAPKGTPVLAVVDGELSWMNMDEEPTSYNGVPSYTILLRGDDGNDYFYIHLNNDSPDSAGGYTDDGQGGIEHAYGPGLTNGIHVTQGQVIGYVGDSGNAEETISHLHFEIHVGGYRNPVDPYPSLVAAPTLVELEISDRTFRDVAGGQWYYDDLMWLHELGIVEGSEDGTFGPYEDVTRAQFAALVVRALVGDGPTAQAEEITAFSDIGPGHWAAAEIARAVELGIVNGKGDGRFDPDSSITRAQMAAMMCRAVDVVGGDTMPGSDGTPSDGTPSDGTLSGGEDGTTPSGDGTGEQQPGPSDASGSSDGPGASAPGDTTAPSGDTPGDDTPDAGTPPGDTPAAVFSDVPPDHWAAEEIGRASEMKLLSGRSDGTFDPGGTTKRAHAAVVIARALRLLDLPAAGPS